MGQRKCFREGTKQWDGRTGSVTSREGPQVPGANRIRKGQKLGINGFFFRVTEITFRNLFSFQPCFPFMDLTFNRICHRQSCTQSVAVRGALSASLKSSSVPRCPRCRPGDHKLPVSEGLVQHIL